MAMIKSNYQVEQKNLNRSQSFSGRGSILHNSKDKNNSDKMNIILNTAATPIPTGSSLNPLNFLF
jgi:hypothetical protein